MDISESIDEVGFSRFHEKSDTHINHEDGETFLQVGRFNMLCHPGSKVATHDSQRNDCQDDLPINIPLLQVLG